MSFSRYFFQMIKISCKHSPDLNQMVRKESRENDFRNKLLPNFLAFDYALMSENFYEFINLTSEM